MLVAGTIGVAATPSYADAFIGVNVSPLGDFNPGGTQTLLVQVTNKIPAGTQDEQITVTVNGLNSDFTVSDPRGCDDSNGGDTACTVTFQHDGQDNQQQLSFKITATRNLPAGQTVTSTGTVHIADLNGHSDSASFQVAAHGAAAPPPTTAAAPTTQPPTMVNSVSGTVKDISTGEPIPDANVAIQDDAGHTYSAHTGSSGKFSFRSSDGNPIAPGELAIVVTKDGYQEKDLSENTQAGKSYDLGAVVLTSTTAPSSSSSLDPIPTLASPTGTVVGIQPPPAASSKGGSGFSTILIVLGVILVLAGGGAIGYMIWRRRKEDDGFDGDDGDDDGPGPRRGPTPVPAARGGYRDDATMVARGGGYGDQTVVSREMAEAPTMMHRPVVDEYADPYGAPDPTQVAGGYGAPTAQYQGEGYGDGYGGDPYADGGYGDRGGYDRAGGYDSGTGAYEATQPAYGTPPARPAADPYASPGDYGGYNEPTTYGRAEPPSSGGGYGASRPSSGGGYGADQATSRYGGPDQATSRYGGGYESGGGYETGSYESYGSGGSDAGYEPGHRGGGYQDSTRRYEGDSYGGGYDEPRGGGYPPADGGTAYGGGYEDDQRGGYEPRAGREQRGGYQPRGGYQSPADPYEPRGGHAQRGGGHEPPQETRRSLDWLDD